MVDAELLTGEARKIKTRTERRFSISAWLWNYKATQGGRVDVDVCSFVVEKFDDEGNTSVVAVEISSRDGFAGHLDDGDRVALYAGEKDRAGSYVVAAVRNLSTGAIFGDRKAVQRGTFIVPPAR